MIKIVTMNLRRKSKTSVGILTCNGKTTASFYKNKRKHQGTRLSFMIEITYKKTAGKNISAVSFERIPGQSGIP
jgi:hypothetical protein